MSPRWIAFYADGSDYSGPPEECPRWGLACIAQENAATGHQVLIGDFFLFLGDRWWACDLAGAIDQLAHRGAELKAFRLGRQLGGEEWQALLSRALNSNLPARSAFGAAERRPA